MDRTRAGRSLISVLGLALLCYGLSTVEYISFFAKDADAANESTSSEMDLWGAFKHPDTNTTNPSGRPVFALHVGPAKTATTYLQYSLTDYREVLKRDNYRYLGQIMDDPTDMWDHHHGPILHILKDRKCMKDVNKARVHGSKYPGCWKDLEQMLHIHLKRGESLLLSEEELSVKSVDMRNIERTSIDWKALADLLQDVGYEPLVIIGYRRLGEILPSAKQQWDREGHVKEWPQDGGRILEPLFPGVLEDPRLIPMTATKRYYSKSKEEERFERVQWSYTDHVLQLISPFLPVRLLNLHYQQEPEHKDSHLDLRSYFLCHVLPYAPNACAQALHDASRPPTKSKEIPRNAQVSTFYDALVVAASGDGLLDTNWLTRREAGVVLHEVLERKYNNSAIEEQFVLTCPTLQQLQPVLEASLVKEEAIWGSSIAEQWKQDHAQDFQKHIQSYCWIDTKATLRRLHPFFKHDFASLAARKKKKKKKH